MKKIIIVLSATIFCLFNIALTSSFAVSESDYQVVADNNPAQDYKEVMEINNLLFIKLDDKFGIIDKRTNDYILKPIADNILSFNDENETEFKIIIKNKPGYINTDTAVNFMTIYDDLFLTDKYIKTKKDGKYGLIDKNGNTILYPEFQNVSILYSDEKEYISAKKNGKYKLFYKTGKLIPEEELYSVQFFDRKYYTLAADIRPEFKKSGNYKEAVYEKINTINENIDNLVYEIKEIKLPGKIKKDIPENTYNETSEEMQDNEAILNIGKKSYFITNIDSKIGLDDINGKTIIPAVYDSYKLTTPCEHFSTPLILAEKNGTYTLYNTKGKILAEQVYDKINVYRFGQVYSYTQINGISTIKENNREIGVLSKENNDYKFVRTGFSLFMPHKINELIITILNAQEN